MGTQFFFLVLYIYGSEKCMEATLEVEFMVHNGKGKIYIPWIFRSMVEKLGEDYA